MCEQEFLVFKAVAETKNITMAARRLHISQPAISYYGAKFLNRRKGVTLTKAGMIFYEYV